MTCQIAKEPAQPAHLLCSTSFEPGASFEALQTHLLAGTNNKLSTMCPVTVLQAWCRGCGSAGCRDHQEVVRVLAMHMPVSSLLFHCSLSRMQTWCRGSRSAGWLTTRRSCATAPGIPRSRASSPPPSTAPSSGAESKTSQFDETLSLPLAPHAAFLRHRLLRWHPCPVRNPTITHSESSSMRLSLLLTPHSACLRHRLLPSPGAWFPRMYCIWDEHCYAALLACIPASASHYFYGR